MASVRELDVGDLDALLALYGDLFEDPPERTPAVESGWREVLADERTTVLGVEHDGSLVSTCQLSIVPSVTHGGRPFGVLEYVVTHADYRGMGFGRQCVEAAIERARERDCYKVLVQTGREDPRVHAFYERCGFDPDAKTGYSLSLDET